MVITPVLLAATLLQPTVGDETLVILATHDLPTLFESRLLSESLEKTRQDLDSSGYVVEAEDRFVFIRHQNLFNIAAMDEALDAISALEAIVRSGTRYGSFDRLDESARAGLKRILFPLARDFGPLLNNDATQFEIRSHLVLKVSDGKKSVQIEVPQYKQERTPTGFHSPQPSQSEIAEFLKNDAANHSFPPYSERLLFSFSKATVQSSIRADGAERFSKKLHELLDAQAQRYARQYGALEAALFSDSIKIFEGQSVSSLDDATRKFINDYFTADESLQSFGFESKLHLRAFLDDAKIQSVQQHVSAGIGSNTTGHFPRRGFTSVRVNRNLGQ